MSPYFFYITIPLFQFTSSLIFDCIHASIVSGLVRIKLNEIPKLDTPVWSLATCNSDLLTPNMNIVTFAYPISIKPSPLWMASLYKNTLSFDNFQRNEWGVLQQLTTNHISCIDILGKQSGRVVDKRKALLEVEISMSSQQLHSSSLGMELLDGCSLYLSIRKERDTAVIDVGDHSCFVCKIEAISTSSFQQTDDINPTNHPLTTKCLRDIGIIS